MATTDPFSAPKNLLPYIDAAEKSSQRARYVVALITIASVLAFASFWNSRENSWFQQRMRSTELALKYFGKSCESDAVPVEERETCKQAQDYAAQRHIKIIEHLESQVQYMNQADVENVTLIRIPFFGVTFDVNDLGVLSGIAFTILLFWLMYALVSERHDVRFLFRTAIEMRAPDRPDLLLPIYRLLAMRQVLSVPPLIFKNGAPPDHANETNNRRLLNSAAKALFFMPVVVHSAILWNDFGTRPLGETISTDGTNTAIVASAVLFSLIAVLTAICVRVSSLTDKEWAYASDQIYRGLPAKLVAMPSSGTPGLKSES
jgi:hypothetical protein